MSDSAPLKLIEPTVLYDNIPEWLRELASRVEAGEHGRVKRLLVLVEGEYPYKLEQLLAGPILNGREWAGLLMAAVIEAGRND